MDPFSATLTPAARKWKGGQLIWVNNRRMIHLLAATSALWSASADCGHQSNLIMQLNNDDDYCNNLLLESILINNIKSDLSRRIDRRYQIESFHFHLFFHRLQTSCIHIVNGTQWMGLLVQRQTARSRRMHFNRFSIQSDREAFSFWIDKDVQIAPANNKWNSSINKIPNEIARTDRDCCGICTTKEKNLSSHWWQMAINLLLTLTNPSFCAWFVNHYHHNNNKNMLEWCTPPVCVYAQAYTTVNQFQPLTPPLQIKGTASHRKLKKHSISHFNSKMCWFVLRIEMLNLYVFWNVVLQLRFIYIIFIFSNICRCVGPIKLLCKIEIQSSNTKYRSQFCPFHFLYLFLLKSRRISVQNLLVFFVFSWINLTS